MPCKSTVVLLDENIVGARTSDIHVVAVSHREELRELYIKALNWK